MACDSLGTSIKVVKGSRWRFERVISILTMESERRGRSKDDTLQNIAEGALTPTNFQAITILLESDFLQSTHIHSLVGIVNQAQCVQSHSPSKADSISDLIAQIYSVAHPRLPSGGD